MPQYDLMQHQKDGVAFLESVDGVGALLFDPGVGKTGTTLAWLDLLASREKEVRVLVVAPLTAADTWVLQAPPFMDSVVKARMLQGSTKNILTMLRQSRDWTKVPDLPVMANHPGIRKTQIGGQRVTILSMSAGAVSSWCANSARRVQMIGAIRRYDPHVIVVDESHIIKAHNSNISKAMYYFSALAPHRIILTGTVTPLSPLDVYGQWRFLAPWTFSDQRKARFTKKPSKMTRAEIESIKPWSWERFKSRYSTPGGYKGKGIGSFQNLDELRALVAERSMVVRKEDALDLPPVTDIDVHVTLSAKEQKFYNEMRDDLAAQLDSGELLEAPNVLAKIMKLRQITGGLVRDTETGETHIVGDSKRKTVKEICEVQLAGEDRIVVFAYFRTECEELARTLRKPGTKVEIITGSTPAKERLAIRQRFGDVSGNPERTILVAQARTMSLSVNELVTAQHAVFATFSDRRDDWVQGRGRLDRNGQKGSHVTFWNCIAPGTVDEIILNKHKDRGDLEAALLDHIRNSPKKRK